MGKGAFLFQSHVYHINIPSTISTLCLLLPAWPAIIRGKKTGMKGDVGLKEQKGGPLTIQSVERALAILETLAQAARPLSVIDICEAVGVQRTTLYALINTLIAGGYVLRGEDGRLTISSKLYELSSMYPARLPIVHRGNRHITEMAQRYHVAMRLSICTDEGRVVTVASSEPAFHVSNVAPQGGELALHATSTGKVLLAYLPREESHARIAACGMERFTAYTITDREALERDVAEVARRGYAQDEREYLDDTTCLSFPILNRDKRLMAILSATSDYWHMKEVYDAVVREGLQRSKIISMDLSGGTPISAF